MTWPGERQRHAMSARRVLTARGSSSKQIIIDDYDFTQGIKDMFKPGHVGYNKPHYDEDWFRYKPDGSVESHELCAGCNPDDTCDFHPPNCDCSHGACQPDHTDEYDTKVVSYPTPELIPTELQEELLEEFHRGIDAGMTRDQAISSAVEHVVEKIENLNFEGIDEKEVDTETYYAMENMLAQESSLPAAYGKQYTKFPFNYTMPLGPLKEPLKLDHGTKVKLDLDGVKIFSGVVSMTESESRWLDRAGYNPDEVVMITFWRGRIKNTDFFPKSRIIATKQPEELKFNYIRDYKRDRPQYSTVQVVKE